MKVKKQDQRLAKKVIKLEKKLDENYQRRYKTTFLLIAVVAMPLILLIGLLLTYLVYFPLKNRGQHFALSSPTAIGAFVIVMLLLVLTIIFIILMLLNVKKRVIFDHEGNKMPKLLTIGFISSFFDAIGVGSYSLTIMLMNITKINNLEKKVPGTLTIGYAVPTMLEAMLMVGAVEVDILTLIVAVVSATIGGLLGSIIANFINPQIFKVILGTAMFIVGIAMILVHPWLGEVIKISADGLTGFIYWWHWLVGVIGFFILGTLSALGLGIFAPTIAFLTLLGFAMTAIFPIMMSAGSFLLIPASLKYVKDKNYFAQYSVSFMLAGSVGALCSFLIFFVGVLGLGQVDETIFNNSLKIVAILVIFLSSISMFSDFFRIYHKNKVNRAL